MTKTLPLSALLCCLAIFNSAPCHAQVLELDKGDHICLVGNELGERMQHHNYWETLLHQAFADKQLAVRNLCFPGDEPFIRLRSKNFGTPESHLRHSQADVILYFFGFNESFAGAAGLSKFGEELRRLVDETKAQDFSGKGSPRIVLVSPIAFENTGDRNLPNGVAENQRLAAYTKAMSSVAKVTGVGFVDLFTPTKQLFEESDKRLTLNGAHLNESGYQALAPILMKGLFGHRLPISLAIWPSSSVKSTTRISIGGIVTGPSTDFRFMATAAWLARMEPTTIATSWNANAKSWIK